jgi:hypothetical protein
MGYTHEKMRYKSVFRVGMSVAIIPPRVPEKMLAVVQAVGSYRVIVKPLDGGKLRAVKPKHLEIVRNEGILGADSSTTAEVLIGGVDRVSTDQSSLSEVGGTDTSGGPSDGKVLTQTGKRLLAKQPEAREASETVPYNSVEKGATTTERGYSFRSINLMKAVDAKAVIDTLEDKDLLNKLYVDGRLATTRKSALTRLEALIDVNPSAERA